MESEPAVHDGAGQRLDRRRVLRAALGAGAGMVGGTMATQRGVAGARLAPRAARASAFQPPGPLVFALKADDQPKIQVLVDEYAAQHNVAIETAAFPQDVLYEKLNIALIAATGEYDVVSLDDPWMPLFGGGGFLRDLDALGGGEPLGGDADLVPELLALGRFPNQEGLRGVPWVGNVQVFVHRADVLAELGLTAPETWDDVLAAARAVADAKGASGPFGFGVRGMRGNPAATSFLPVLRGFGGDLFPAEGGFEPQLTTPAALEAIRLHLELATLTPPGVETVGHVEHGRNLTEGRIVQSGDVWPDQVAVAFDPAKSVVAGALTVGGEPAQPGIRPATMTGNWLLGIPETSVHPERALAFVRWFTAPAQQRRLLLEQGVPPTRASVFRDEEATERLPFLPALLDAARDAVPRPRTQHYPNVEEIVGRLLAEAIAGTIPGEAAMRQANAEIRALMVREGELEE